MDNRLRTIAFITLAMIIFNTKCISPTYECAQVRKGNHGWCGFTGGYRSCDYSIPDGESYVDSRALIGSVGFTHGFNDNTAIYYNGAIYFASCKSYVEAQSRKFGGFATLSLGIKFEPTSSSDPIAVSFATGPTLTEGWRSRIMFGFRGTSHGAIEDSTDRREFVSFGTNITLLFPTEVFTNLRIFGNSGVVLYVGYRFPYMYPSGSEDIAAKNIAIGIGYEW